VTTDLISRARPGGGDALREVTEPHRRELQVHCYRMPGSFQDAGDALQDTLLTAWQGLGGFEGRASIRTWLYRIATNRCLSALRSASRRPGQGNGTSPRLNRPSRPGSAKSCGSSHFPTRSSRCDQRAVGKPSVPEELAPHRPRPLLAPAPSQPPSAATTLARSSAQGCLDGRSGPISRCWVRRAARPDGRLRASPASAWLSCLKARSSTSFRNGVTDGLRVCREFVYTRRWPCADRRARRPPPIGRHFRARSGRERFHRHGHRRVTPTAIPARTVFAEPALKTAAAPQD
jgi:RNA polymerase sigma factor (sigma-70 family)